MRLAGAWSPAAAASRVTRALVCDSPIMTTLDLSTANRAWTPSVDQPWAIPTPSSERLERLLPVLTGLCLLAVDLGLVVGAFMAAHWLRFLAADESLAALGVDQYVLMACVISVLTSGLF